jgi:peroxiredoxin Q/BCP
LKLETKKTFKHKIMTHLKIGDKAPNFSGTDQNGKAHSLADYSGKKLVVFFYPKANTPGCTAEACDLRDNYERFQANNYELLGVSADSAKVQFSLCFISG